MSQSQNFIAGNSAPRVQIEHKVDLYCAQNKMQLSSVMGVFSDLSGKAEKLAVADRKFLEIDVEHFDERMRATQLNLISDLEVLPEAEHVSDAAVDDDIGTGDSADPED